MERRRKAKGRKDIKEGDYLRATKKDAGREEEKMKINQRYVVECENILDFMSEKGKVSPKELLDNGLSESFDSALWQLRYLEECDLVLAVGHQYILNVEMVKKCQSCGQAYIQKTAREKKYCSDRCKNAFNFNKRRESDL